MPPSSQWTPERLRQIAPDEGTYQRSLPLHREERWLHSGYVERRYLWGILNYYGQASYRVLIDTETLRHHCTCPVRNTPCKHVIGLLACHANPRKPPPHTGTIPSWVMDWMAKQPARPEAPARPPMPDDLQAKHQAALAKRIAEMRPGIAEFKTWLHDLIRRGLASVERESYTFWTDTATRLVDSKARSAADILSAIPDTIQAHDDWHPLVLAELAKLYAMASAFERLDDLPTPLRYDVLKAAGYTYPKRYFDALPTVLDTWEVHGCLVLNDYNGQSGNMRRTWLRGQHTGKQALLLDYSFGGQAFPQHYTVGTAFKAEVVFYPSQYPLRARRLDDDQGGGTLALEDFPHWATGQTLPEMLQLYAQAIGLNPWIPQFPAWLSGMTPIRHQGQLYLRDPQGLAIPVTPHPDLDWQLLAISGGQPLSFMGEWDGRTFRPLSVSLRDRIIALNTVTLRTHD